MMLELTGRKVVVYANDITYTGRLVEVGESELHLETETGWVTIPLEHVVYVRETDEER